MSDLIKPYGYIVAIFAVTFAVTTLGLRLILSGGTCFKLSPNLLPATSSSETFKSTDAGIDHRVTSDTALRMLEKAEALEQKTLYKKAEAMYIRALADESLESHDPVRINILTAYAKLLLKLGRKGEADLIFERAKSILVRRRLDKHPDRAHLS